MVKTIRYFKKNNNGRFEEAGQLTVNTYQISPNWIKSDGLYILNLGSRGEAIVKRANRSGKWVGTIIKNRIGHGDLYFDRLTDAKLYYQD